MICRSPRPLVSVLLPSRNGGVLLREAVASILRQTLHDLELIVIDDHSGDGSLCGLPPDPRLRLMRNPGRGLVDALNAGAAVAQAPLLARMDADDVALPERLERQIALLEAEPGLGIVGAQVEIFTDQGEPGGGFRYYQDWINGLCNPAAIQREIFIESPIPHPTAVFRRALFRRLGGYRERVWAEDYDLWLRAYAAGIDMAKPEGVLLRWRDRPDRLSRTDARCSKASFIRAKAHFLARTRLRRQSAVICGAAPTGALLHDALAAEGVRVRAFVDIDPKKIGGRKRGKPVLPLSVVADMDGDLILGAVAARGGREQLRCALRMMGKQEGEHFLLAA